MPLVCGGSAAYARGRSGLGRAEVRAISPLVGAVHGYEPRLPSGYVRCSPTRA